MFEEVMQALNLTPRDEQTLMLKHVRGAVSTGTVALVQAGTGTGKSYVILSEAITASRMSGLPSLVVCPNNTLINQYVQKDAPRIAEVTGAMFAYLKGRSRYVCVNSPAIMGQAMRMSGLGSRAKRVRLFDEITNNGEVLEWADLGLTSEWGCPGTRKCKPKTYCVCGELNGPDPDYSRCHCPPKCGIMVARQAAALADVVITNAHVLMWDKLVRAWSDNTRGLVPDYGALFVDECHELETIGRDVMSDEIGNRSKLWTESETAYRWREAQIAVMRENGQTERHLDANSAETKLTIEEAYAEQGNYPSDSDEYDRLDTFIRFLNEREGTLAVMQLQLEETEPGSPVPPPVRSFVAQRRLLDASRDFRDILTAQPSVLASGTIPPSDRRRLGITKTRIAYVGHPFDYSKSQLYIAPYDARDRGDLGDRIRMTVKGIRAAQRDRRGTLLLFTSWSDMDLVAQALQSELGEDAPIWVQGREEEYAIGGGSLAQDVAEFAEHGSGILMGVRSLFTGLDIPGSALGQVIVWKLPYAVPTAEVKALQDLWGRSVYSDSMVMTLVQAIGRLIRSHDDTGRVMIMDDRARRLNFGDNPMMHHLNEFTRVGW